jgi:Na+(H+)/acetate symporter ActP
MVLGIFWRRCSGAAAVGGMLAGGAVTVDGLQINLASGSINDGDSFLLQPTRGASGSL